MNLKEIPGVVKIQLIVASIALIVTVGAAFTLTPLTQKKAQLEEDKAVLTAQTSELQQSNSLLRQAAGRPFVAATKALDGWVYVGRLTDSGNWAPPAQGITVETGNIDAIKSLSVKKEVPIVGSDGNDQPREGAFAAADQGNKISMVKAGSVLTVQKIWKHQSIGGAWLIWAKVNVPPDNILEIAR